MLPMRLADLMAAPGLGIRVLHGDEHDLARPLAAGAETTLSLGLHGVSVVPGSA